MTPETLRPVIEPAVATAGLTVDSISVAAAGKRKLLRVFVDLPADRIGPLDLEAVAQASAAVSRSLDDTDVLGDQPYVLEVSSPGVDRPLTERRHWMRARTMMVRVPVGPQTVTGRVTKVDDDGVQFDVSGSARMVSWQELGVGRIQVEFDRPVQQDVTSE
ncbi:MAG: ribosome maturation factor RimP [Micrococcales bacterium]|nr:MAG: ribosome maturation factor RimP [Micrococcales bacterium]PIE27108.1 MAG: ribosome maturation factor RimP [Micrococcales bacterium]